VDLGFFLGSPLENGAAWRRLAFAGTLGLLEFGLEIMAFGLETVDIMLQFADVLLQFGDAVIALSAARANGFAVHTFSVGS
jgi:hypothetical protein